MDRIPSMLFCVGEDHYTLAEFIDEAKDDGVSKRLSMTSVPVGMEVGLSKILLAHPKAILKVTETDLTLEDLAYVLLTLEVLSELEYAKLIDYEMEYWEGENLEPGDPVPTGMLKIAYAFSKLRPTVQASLVKQFGIKFCLGIFASVPFGGFQYVCRPGETDLPEHLADQKGYITPVNVVYTDGDERCPTCDRPVLPGVPCDFCKEQ